MKSVYPIIRFYVFVFLVVIIFRLLGYVSANAYDEVLKWLNVGVLIYAIISFGGMPIRNFLISQKEDLAQEIEKIETEKEAIRQKIFEAEAAVKESQAHFAELRERITLEGERKKEQILADAQEKSAIMLQGAKQRIDRMINEAKASFASEMIDTAIELVEKQLGDMVTETDNQKYIDRYMTTHISQR